MRCQGLSRHIDGTRPVEEVWADTRNYIADVDSRVCEPRVEYAVHVYASEGDGYVADVAARIADDANRRWGADAVDASGATFGVSHSLKAFELDSLRAFD